MRIRRIGLFVVVSAFAIPAWGASGDDGIRVILSKGPSAGNVSLQWTGGAQPYSVFRSTTPVDATTPGSYLGTAATASWVDTPPVGGTYFYYVQGECNYNPPEICDGLDNDCDPGTADGSQDPEVGAACDGADGDGCLEGTKACFGGGFTCDDATTTTPEICIGDGGDENCDGTVDEGFIVNTNPVCDSYQNVGGIWGDIGSGSVSISGYKEGWFRVNLVESSSGDYDLSAVFALYSPPGTDFDLYVRCLACAGSTNGWSFNRGMDGHTDTTFILRRDTERIDTFPILIEIRNYASSYCGRWTLVVQGNSGGPYESCPNP